MDDIWEKLCSYWNYLNYTLLESFIESLEDPELSHKMESYLQLHKIFLRHTHVCDFAEHCPVTTQEVKTELKDFVIRLDLDWDRCTLEEVDDRADHIMRKFHLPKFLMNLKEITSGSILITWSLPAVLASRVRSDLENTDLSSFKKEHGILTVTIGGQECKYSAVKHYSAYLKDLYSHNPDKTFKLAHRVEESEIGEVRQSTILHSQRQIKPRLILIEGAPGIGKTTFSQQFSATSGLRASA